MKLHKASQIAGAPNWQERIITNNQKASDIVEACLHAVKASSIEASKLAPILEKSNVFDTCENIYKFIKLNIRYEKEPNTRQTVKTLKRVLHPAEGFGDCKHYSIIAGALCKALGYPVYFRVIDQLGRWNHIYVVVKYPGEPDIIIDACYPYFDRQANYFKKKDIKI